MRKITILCIILLIVLLYVNFTSAQGIAAKGIKGGLNFANVKFKGVDDTALRLGFAIGGFVTYKINKLFSLQPEIYYTSKGFKREIKIPRSGQDWVSSFVKESLFVHNYIEIPVLGVFSVKKNSNLFAGPYLDYFLNGQINIDWESDFKFYDPEAIQWISRKESGSKSDNVESENMRRFGFGLLFGVEFLIDQFSISASYSMGLSNILDTDDDVDIKDRVIQLLIGLSL